MNQTTEWTTVNRPRRNVPPRTLGTRARTSVSQQPQESGPRRLLRTEVLNRSLEYLKSRPELSKALTKVQAGLANKFLKKKKPDPEVVRKSANELYKSMHSGLFGMGTDEDRLYKALKDKTPEEIAAIKKEYKDHYGRNLNADLKDELSGSEYKRAQALMSSKKEAAAADALYQAVDGAGTNEAAIMSTLKDKSPREIKKIKYEYKKRYGRTLEKDLEGDLSGTELDQAKALLKSDKAGSAVAQLRQATDGAGTDEAKVYRILEGASPRERRAIKKAYYEKTGRRLDDTLKSEFSGAELNRAMAGLKGDKAGVGAARLDEAMRGLGTNEAEIYQVLEGKSDKERAAIIKAYKRQTGRDLTGSLKSEMSGNDLDQANSLLDDGKLTAAERLHFATDRLGTDEDAIRASLKGKTSEEIAKIRAEFKQRYGKNLDTVLDSELTGRDAFETKLALRGKPKNALEALEVANARYRFERGGSSNSFGAGVLDLYNDSGRVLDRNHRRANDYAKKALADGVLTKAESARLNKLTGFQSDDVDYYQETKDSVADTAGEVGAAVASAVAVVASGGAAAPLLSLAAGVGAGAAGRVGLTAAISGQSYGTEQLLMDAGYGAIEGVGVKGGFVAGRMARKSVQRGVRSTVRGSVKRRIVRYTAQGMADGAVDGAIAGAGRQIFTDGTWDRGIDTGLGRVLGGAALGGLQTGAIGVKGYPMELLENAGLRVAKGTWSAGGQVFERLGGRIVRAAFRR